MPRDMAKVLSVVIFVRKIVTIVFYKRAVGTSKQRRTLMITFPLPMNRLATLLFILLTGYDYTGLVFRSTVQFDVRQLF